MRKFLILGLSFILVLSSVALVFADATGSPVILPVSDSEAGSLPIILESGAFRYYYADSSPVYLCFFSLDGQNSLLSFSESSGTHVFYGPSGNLVSHTLSSEYNGYYFSQSYSSLPVDGAYFIGQFESVQDAIDFVDDTVFSTTFDLSYLVNGSVSWLSSMAQAVVSNGLLLFFVLIIFVGVGVGLFRRFI